MDTAGVLRLDAGGRSLRLAPLVHLGTRRPRRIVRPGRRGRNRRILVSYRWTSSWRHSRPAPRVERSARPGRRHQDGQPAAGPGSARLLRPRDAGVDGLRRQAPDHRVKHNWTLQAVSGTGPAATLARAKRRTTTKNTGTRKAARTVPVAILQGAQHPLGARLGRSILTSPLPPGTIVRARLP